MYEVAFEVYVEESRHFFGFSVDLCIVNLYTFFISQTYHPNICINNFFQSHMHYKHELKNDIQIKPEHKVGQVLHVDVEGEELQLPSGGDEDVLGDDGDDGDDYEEEDQDEDKQLSVESYTALK